MKRFYLRLPAAILFMVAGVLSAVGQEKLKFQITDFAQDQFDLSAKDPRFQKPDGNGDLYSIIKVTSANPDDKLNEYNFNFGNMNHIVVEKDGELWVYVQRNAKSVSITRSGYAPILKYDLKTTIGAGKNYIMTLTSEGKKVLTQMVRFDVKPTDSRAVIMIKPYGDDRPEEIFGTVDETGSVAKSLQYGTYSYRVLADNYHMSDGQFTLKDKTVTHVEPVELRGNYSEITFKVDSNADIYINGEHKGARQWSGKLKAGEYQVECRQTNYKPTSQYVTVSENDTRTITLTPPTPILGTLSVTSNPLGAEIFIDGKSYGMTPANVEVVIGNHDVKLVKDNYADFVQSVTVQEKTPASLNGKLSQTTKFTINLNRYADIYIDGEYKGIDNKYVYEGRIGNHKVKLKNSSCPTVSKTVNFSNNGSININLHERLIKPGEFYMAAGVGFGSDLNITAALGFYAANVNIEGFYSYSFRGADDIYWNAVTQQEDYGLPSSSSYAYTYKPAYILGAKAGYGVILGTRFRLTPQIGYRYTAFSEKKDGGSDMIKGMNCSSLTFGLRAYFAVSRSFGLSLTPEYGIGISESDGFKLISQVSSKLKGYKEGFMGNFSLVLTF